jgi:hypothetical protein
MQHLHALSRKLCHPTCLLAAVLLVLNSCGPAALPGPAQKPVSDTDVVGTWSYWADFKKTRVEIQFTADHRFSQVLTGPDGTIKRQAGTWHLSGAYLDISDILENESVSGFNASSWKKSDALWWFADDRGFLELMGGESSEDPDQCWPLQKLPEKQAPKASN